MNRFILLLGFLLFKLSLFSQVTLFQDNFENNVAGWTSFSDVSPNYWISGVCAGNGSTAAGQKAIYITFGGAAPGCGFGGTINYGYLNSDNGGSKSTIIAHLIEASCASDLSISFDQFLSVDGVNDFGELIYSTDNGLSWQVVGSVLNSNMTWTTVTTSLPSSLDFTDFLLGFRFTYDNLNIGSNPLAVDNIRVRGTDSEDPVITCPPTQTLYANSSCSAVIQDYISLASASDNCIALNALTITQNPLSGTTISANSNVQITVFDLSGNSANCTMAINLLDTISPMVVCQDSLTFNVNSNCQFQVPDLSTTLTFSDNCTSNSNMIFTQIPVAGSTATSFTTVLVTVTDQSGNSADCSIVLVPNDTQAPTVICPSDITVQNGTICSYAITDFTSQINVIESCLNYSIEQNPAVNVEIGTGSHTVDFLVTDLSGNTSTCSFILTVLETIPPVFTNCPASIISCEPLVSYSELFATDNCATIEIQQTDQSGLTSGSSFPIGITPQQYTVTDLSGNTAVCNFNIEVFTLPSDAIIAVDSAEICLNLTYNLVANPINSGVGTWSQIANVSTIANPTNSTTAVSNFSPGINTYVWSVSTQNCGVKTDTIYITVYSQPTIASIQSDSVYICSAQSTLLLGTFPTSGTPEWSTIEGASIVNPNQHNTAANSLSQGWNTFIYTISNGTCLSSDDTLNVYSNNIALIQTNDTTVCVTDAFTINAQDPTNTQTSAWYFIKGKGDILSPNSSNSLVENINAGENLIVYRLTHPVCGFTYDTLTIMGNNCTGEEFIIPTVITPNSDGKNDNFRIDNLNILYPNCEVIIVNRWGTIVFESIGYNKPWDGQFKGEDLPMGTYYYKILLNNSQNASYSGPISIIR